MLYREAILAAARSVPHHGPTYDLPIDDEFRATLPLTPSPARARKRAIEVLRALLADDPDFAGLSMNTDGLHLYVAPPREYYLAQVELTVGFVASPATLDRNSSDIRRSLQDAVKGTGYAVSRNCCNKPMVAWQLDKIRQAFLSSGVRLDTTQDRSIAKIQRYAKAHRAGLVGGTPFRIDGFILDEQIIVQDRCFTIFKTNGYDAFKKDGKKFTLGNLKSLAAR